MSLLTQGNPQQRDTYCAMLINRAILHVAHIFLGRSWVHDHEQTTPWSTLCYPSAFICMNVCRVESFIYAWYRFVGLFNQIQNNVMLAHSFITEMFSIIITGTRLLLAPIARICIHRLLILLTMAWTISVESRLTFTVNRTLPTPIHRKKRSRATKHAPHR